MAKRGTKSSQSQPLVNGVKIDDLCGWVPDEERIADFAMENPPLAMSVPHLMSPERRDVFLWQPLLQVIPGWRRGAQGIGDCVSWGQELSATCLMCIQHMLGHGMFVAEAATEAIYGGCRVEALGKSAGGWSDGAFGASAAKWVRDWGVVLRVDMSQSTGISSHDLRQYDSKKAKDWGNYGCGGQSDGGRLDLVAKEMPVQRVVQVTTVEECAASIMNGYPVTIASMAGFGDMRRDRDGVCRMTGRWAHQMVILGIRWVAGQPQFRIFQSWGPRSCSGPDPGITHPAISGCSWWAVAEDVAWILRTGDCWSNGDQAGMPPRRLDFARPAAMWNRDPATVTYSMAT